MEAVAEITKYLGEHPPQYQATMTHLDLFLSESVEVLLGSSQVKESKERPVLLDLLQSLFLIFTETVFFTLTIHTLDEGIQHTCYPIGNHMSNQNHTHRYACYRMAITILALII